MDQIQEQHRCKIDPFNLIHCNAKSILPRLAELNKLDKHAMSITFQFKKYGYLRLIR